MLILRGEAEEILSKVHDSRVDSERRSTIANHLTHATHYLSSAVHHQSLRTLAVIHAVNWSGVPIQTVRHRIESSWETEHGGREVESLSASPAATAAAARALVCGVGRRRGGGGVSAAAVAAVVSGVDGRGAARVGDGGVCS